MKFPIQLDLAHSAILVLGLLVLPSKISGDEPACHMALGEEALNFLATKRPYFYNSSNEKPQDFNPEGCTPVKLWYFGRHGTRYPGDSDIIAMQTILPKLHEEILSYSNSSDLCPETLEYFSSWMSRPDLNIPMNLHTQGEWELSSIASRYVQRFPDLFPSYFTNDSYLFKSTKSQRTEASAHSFASSIFTDRDSVYFPKPLSKDPILKFYSLCPKWEQEVANNPVADREHDLFINSTIMAATIAAVSKRTGLQRNLTLKEVTIVYTTCAFETAWNNGTLSEWCTLFDLQDFKVMQYTEDLQYYSKDGYAHSINWEQACTPFVDALHFFDEYSSSNEGNNASDYRKVQAYFSHSGSTLKMFARLGLFNGSNDTIPMDIRHDNYEEMKDIYEWKTSQIDFFGTNMAFVMYTCQNNGDLQNTTKQIGFFAQEKPTKLSACDGKAFCSYQHFSSRLNEYTRDCDLNRLCTI